MNTFSKEIYFREPHLTGGVCTIVLTEAQAINAQRLYQIASNKCPIGGDDSLLLDYMVIHGASYVGGA